MKYHNKNWPYQWFGFWKEYGVQYQNYPSIKDFIDGKRNAEYDKDRLITYLQSGVIVAITGRQNFPSPITGAIVWGSVSLMTDGKWVWLETIEELIEHHNLVIPEVWYREIEQRNYCFPHVTDGQIQLLENMEWSP